ncbi:MAG: threonine dehydratase [Alphaproteobacteria bacterium]|nr:threonine dehydratase [Alphaproteobacteria bacterium]
MTKLAELEAAAAVVYESMAPTPQFCWPLLCDRTGCEVWVKHENHTPIGAFKVRGGLVFMDWLRRERPDVVGVVTATRGNHGQSVAYVSRRRGIPAVIVVPYGNSREKNAAMRAHGAELIEHGADFQDAFQYAERLAGKRNLYFWRTWDPVLVTGVASYSLELFSAVPDIDTVYLPIGHGSGICGAIAARDALGLKTEIVGVVSERFPAYARSFASGRAVSTEAAETVADGVACRVPDPRAVAIILTGAARIVTVSEPEIAAAMVHYFTDTHNVAEGAGALPLAALLKERSAMCGRRVALVLSGGNVDCDVFARILAAAG